MRKVFDAGDLVKVAGGLDVVKVGVREIMRDRLASRRCRARMFLMVQELQLRR
jgi:hypothetical protein